LGDSGAIQKAVLEDGVTPQGLVPKLPLLIEGEGNLLTVRAQLDARHKDQAESEEPWFFKGRRETFGEQICVHCLPCSHIENDPESMNPLMSLDYFGKLAIERLSSLLAPPVKGGNAVSTVLRVKLG
jgi:hypothetical protein